MHISIQILVRYSNFFYLFLTMIQPQQFIPLALISILMISCDNSSPENTGNEDIEVSTTDTTSQIEEVVDFEGEWVEERMNNIASFANAVITEDITTVANYINFPLEREAPIAAISNAEEFESYFPTLFDDELKNKLNEHLDNPDIIDLSNSNGTIGILNGLIWFNDTGSKIVSINYSSAAEKEYQAEMQEKLRYALHPILKDYGHNVFLGRTEEGLFRIDETEKGLRYASWNGDQNMSDEPDFILWNGVSEQQGTAGGWTTTFDNVDTQYILDQVDMCEDPEDCGLFLVIKDEGEITSKLTVTEITDPFEEITE